MTKKTNPDKPTAGFWGMSAAKWRELGAFALLTLALLLFLSLISENLHKNWMGALGSHIAFGLEFLFGRGVAYVAPALFLLAAIHAFQGRLPFHPVRKVLAASLLLMSLCGALAQWGMQFHDGVSAREEAFALGGALGAFLVHGEGVALGRWLGPAGVYVALAALFLLGVMLSTEFLLFPLLKKMAAGMGRLLTRLKPPPVKAIFAFAQKKNKGERFPRLKIQETEPNIQKNPQQEELPLFPQKEDSTALSFAPQQPQLTGQDEEEENSLMVQTELHFGNQEFMPPSLELFTPPPTRESHMNENEMTQTSQNLERALSDFGISAQVVAVTQGPVVTQYELEPAPGIKVSKILSLENDIALALRAKSVRIQAPIPGKAAIGIEVPNRHVTPVYFKEIIEAPDFQAHKSPLAFALGKNIAGEPVVCDLASMPHLLVAGTTGSGKSVCVNGIISSILFRMPPDKVKFIMIDPKRVELNVYADIPHMLAPVVNEPKQAASALLWAVEQMEQRLKTFSKLRVRNIDGYNEVATGQRNVPKGVEEEDYPYLPHIVIIIDELADLMLVAKKEVEDFIVRLAQMSRAAGIHMIIATQRPSVNVLTGLIKANFPSRIAFRVASKVDSRTILDCNGAETLLGKGDMLFGPGGTKPLRIQGAFLSDGEVEKLTDHLRSQCPEPGQQEDFSSAISLEAEMEGAQLEPGVLEPARTEMPLSDLASKKTTPPNQVEFPEIQLDSESNEDEDLYNKALRMVLESGKPSVSMIQRRLKIGFARAGRLMDLMEERGIVGPYLGSKPRDLVVEDPEALIRRLDEMERDAATISLSE